jgi:hypothetical protein
VKSQARAEKSTPLAVPDIWYVRCRLRMVVNSRRICVSSERSAETSIVSVLISVS